MGIIEKIQRDLVVWVSMHMSLWGTVMTDINYY